MMDREMDRDDNRLRVLIEEMQRDSRPEWEIETAVRKASDHQHRDAKRPSRRLIRFALPRRATKHVETSS